MLKPFPNIQLQTRQKGDEDFNPAIQVFGRRFFADQTVAELLIEFLLVTASPKKISDHRLPEGTVFPDIDQLRAWPDNSALEYAPRARLNLKLFAFLGSSKLETRHISHREHRMDLTQRMLMPDKLSPGSVEPEKVIQTLEHLFLGFQNVGGQRTWCAASFLPIHDALIAGETIWQEAKANRSAVETWDAAIPFFTHNARSFFARGGEMLYLQICNMLRQDDSALRNWAREVGLSLSKQESSTEGLHAELVKALRTVLNACPETVGKLAKVLDTGTDPKTEEQTDYENGPPHRRYSSCGWCPEESWHEGVFFAVELLRVCQAEIDPIERIEMLELACSLQLLRSLCAQSARQNGKYPELGSGSGPLGYVWAISDPAGDHGVTKQISQRNLNAIQRMIHKAVRNPDIIKAFAPNVDLEKAYREADGRYGHKLFLTVAKRIGIVVPKRGRGARFTITDALLRFFVLATIRPGERVTLESFKKLLMVHFGIAVDDDAVARSCQWSGTTSLTTLGGNADAWLVAMLEASGFLIRLSDSCSLVANPFKSGS